MCGALGKKGSGPPGREVGEMNPGAGGVGIMGPGGEEGGTEGPARLEEGPDMNPTGPPRGPD